ncbi:MAG: DNA polymerase III subunit alpha [Candidatus Dependentiae bacterium]|nr:DNA polymerase III subunit alpha [Candidatus Dependentiae bacterium]
MSQHFTHLHLHTEFSLLDGAINLDKLVDFGKQQKFKALAITDHGNIFGAVKFFQKCKKAGIKPIIGMEAYLTEDVTVKTVDKKYYHLVILVQNDIGYKNLCKLISFSFQKGFYFKPRIDYAILEKHSEGLIVTTACLGGHIPSLLMKNDYEQAEKYTDWYLRVFGRDRFYLEVQPEDQKDQTVLNKKIFEWAEKKNLNCVAAGDCHYPTAEDREAHEIMLAIQTHDKMDNPDRYTFGDCRVYMRTQDQMLAEFPGHEQAVWNAGVIADMCNFEFQMGKLFFPKFEIPAEHTQESYFKYMCQIGLERLRDNNYFDAALIEKYQARLDLEVELIISMGFVGYFLVVSDFIQWSYRNNVPVGPGRGSAAGSLVAWALQITNIDPLKYNLLFERFLNPERVSMPDIDIDFCIEGREKVISYIRDRYGHDKVCQIITFGTMMAKGVIKDVSRALGFSFEDSNAITNLIPEQLKISLKEAFEQEPRLKELLDGNPKAKKLFDIAFRLEGLTRHASKHAAGIVISPDPIDEVLPVYIPSKSNDLVTQYAMTELESLGFLKIDLLGLKNLTLIQRALELIEKNHGVKIDINKIPLDDAKSFALICEGKTSGVFQLESDGLKEVLRKLQPEKFEDIIAVNALYRPGPLGSGMVDDFVERRHGRQKITYLFPELATVLEETYGVIVYQEQVMKIASLIGGYSLGEADILRRAMGKKKAEVMVEQREIFLTKAKEQKFDAKKAGELFDLMAYFAGYGFNKSHSAAYALIAYQTAYLKANYTAEFMACLISLEATHAENMSFYLQEAKELGLPITSPNINTSGIQFTVVNNGLLFGLLGIKNIGLASLENIVKEREKKPFADLYDFCKRIDLRTSNKRVIENLISAGAFDGMPGNRAQKHAEVEKIIDLAAEFKKNAATGQMGLFGAVSNGNALGDGDLYSYQPHAEWSEKEKLEKEKEVVGFYLSAHPLDSYSKQLKSLNIQTFAHQLALQLKNNTGHELMTIGCGLVKSRRDITTKKGDRMSFVQLEDGASNQAEIILFPKIFKKVEAWLNSYHIFVVKGDIDIASQQKCKIKANEFVPIDLLFEQWPNIQKISLSLPNSIEESLLQELAKTMTKGSIPLELLFHENGKKLQLVAQAKTTMTIETMQALEKQNVGLSIQL